MIGQRGHFERFHYWVRWWQGRTGSGPYRRDAVVWWLTGGPFRDVRLYSSAMVGCRRLFLDWGNRRWVLFCGTHSYRPQWLATGFVVTVGRLALLTRRNR